MTTAKKDIQKLISYKNKALETASDKANNPSFLKDEMNIKIY